MSRAPLQIIKATKVHPRSQGKLVCLGAIQTVNITRGCGAGCVFCYARCYTGAPPPGQVALYEDLPQQLERDLSSVRRKHSLIDFVVFGSAGDPFIGGDAVVNVARDCLSVLLKHDVGISISTRGVIPPDVLELLGRHKDRVRLVVPLASLSQTYTKQWEPGAAMPEQRLFLLQKAHEAGLNPLVRVEPIIPFVNDNSDAIRQLSSALVSVGVRRAVLGFLQLRRGVAAQLQREAPGAGLRLVLGCFPSLQEWGRPTDFDHIESRQALAGLRRIVGLAAEKGLKITACRCQNPGLPAAHCPISPPRLRPPEPDQPSLFDIDSPPSGAK